MHCKMTKFTLSFGYPKNPRSVEISSVHLKVTSAKMSHHHHINMQRFLFSSVKTLNSFMFCFTVLDIPHDRKITCNARNYTEGILSRILPSVHAGSSLSSHWLLSMWMLSTLFAQHVRIWKCTFSQHFTCVKYSPRCIVMWCVITVLVPSTLSHCITVLCRTRRIPGNTKLNS